MHISRATNSRRTRYSKTTGQEFFGQIEEMPGGTSDVDYKFPRRIIRVSPLCSLQAGDIFKSLGNQYFLCGKNASSEMGNQEIYRTFRIFEVAQKLPWSRFVRNLNPITGVLENGEAENLGEVFVSLEPIGDSRDSTRVADPKYRMVTSSPIEEGDVVGQYKVLRTDNMLGLVVAEVQ